MNGQAFIQLVIEMRAAQKCWFETRKYVYLNRAKRLEAQVDNILTLYKDSLDKITPTQMEFNFDEQ